MGKHAYSNLDVKRSDCLWFRPEDLVLVTDKESLFYDPRVELPVDDGLVQNILFNNQGVLQPIIITKDGDNPVVLAGRQRVKAALRANELLKEQGAELLKVPCLNKKAAEADLYGMSISENENRKDDSIVAKAKKVARYYNFGGNRKGAAKIFGVTEQAIKTWEKMLDLATPVIKAIEHGLISASAAAKLASLPRAEQAEKIKELIAAENKPTTKSVGRSTPRSKSQKPKTRAYKVIEQALDSNNDLPEDARTVLEWVLCKIDDLPIEWA